MTDTLYDKMMKAREESDAADAETFRVEFNSPAFIAACQDRDAKFAVWVAARDEYEASLPHDPMLDFNYVGHPAHY